MSETPQEQSTPSEIPVTVLVECRQARVGQWVEDQWEAIAVVAGEEVVASESMTTLVHQDAECRRYLWTGFRLMLYKDACESYWYNLMSGKPRLYVICHVDEDEDGETSLIPVLITADQDEATAHMETDDRVYPMPMPEQVHQWVERYVVENYVPVQKKKRQRQRWAEESEHVEASEHHGSRPVRH